MRSTRQSPCFIHCGLDLISDALPFNAIDYAKCYSRSHNAVIRGYDEAGNVIETHEHAGRFVDS